MKNNIGLVICPLVYLIMQQAAPAQCPQSCGDNFNTGFGVAVTTGLENTVVGTQGLALNQNGGQNTIVGALAGFGIIGRGNTAIGDKTLNNNFSGDNNTALGYAALSYCGGTNNIGIGAVGGAKVTTGSRNIEIGNQGTAGDNRVIRLGSRKTQRNTYIAGISGVTVGNGVGVIIDSDGHLGTITSSARYKRDIAPMKKASEALLSLQPVTFHYKKDLDPQATPQFGLVAEEVAKVAPDLVVRDESGQPYTVRYEAVNAMLLNEFLKEHRKVEAQERKVESLEETVSELKAALKEQAAQVQKISAEVQLAKPSPRVVVTE